MILLPVVIGIAGDDGKLGTPFGSCGNPPFTDAGKSVKPLSPRLLRFGVRTFCCAKQPIIKDIPHTTPYIL